MHCRMWLSTTNTVRISPNPKYQKSMCHAHRQQLRHVLCKFGLFQSLQQSSLCRLPYVWTDCLVSYYAVYPVTSSSTVNKVYKDREQIDSFIHCKSWCLGFQSPKMSSSTFSQTTNLHSQHLGFLFPFLLGTTEVIPRTGPTKEWVWYFKKAPCI